MIAGEPADELAVAQLLERAAVHVERDQLDEAGAILERALRIAPRDARLWQQLAEVRLMQGRTDQAAALASRSDQFTGDPVLRARNAELMATESHELVVQEAGTAGSPQAIEIPIQTAAFDVAAGQTIQPLDMAQAVPTDLHPYPADVALRDAISLLQGRRPGEAIDVPPGHRPPPGLCRIWYPDRPPGHQPPPGNCQVLAQRLPRGARLLMH